MQKGQAQVLILAGIVLAVAVAGGIFFLGRITAPKPQPQNVTISSPQPSPTPDETVHTESDRTANWKTYTNTNQRVQFKYPPEWYLFEPNNQRLFVVLSKSEIKELPPHGPAGPITIGLNVCTNTITNEQYPCDKSLSERLTKVREEFTSESLSETTNFTLSRKTGVQLSGILGPGPFAGLYIKETSFQFGEYILVIILYDKQYEHVYDQILSTFRFLP